MRISSAFFRSQIVLSNNMLLSVVAIFCSLDLAELIWWYVQSPPDYIAALDVLNSTPAGLVYTPQCKQDNMFLELQFGSGLLLLFWGMWVAWKIRNLPTQFSEAKGEHFC